ncbi:MAG: hypothetical protein M1823_006360, partial [Watsoniomyces obsoletus]
MTDERDSSRLDRMTSPGPAWRYRSPAVASSSTDAEQTDKALRTQLRWHLAGPAAVWLRELPQEQKQTWKKLKAAFLSSYKKETKETEGQKRKRVQDEMQAYRQGGQESLHAYIQRGQRLIDALLAAGFMVEDRFIQGLADERLGEAVRVHLSLRGDEYTFEDAKGVARAIQRGRELAEQDRLAGGRQKAGGAGRSQARSPAGSGAGSGTESADMRRDSDSLTRQMETVVLGDDQRGKYTPLRPVRPAPYTCFNCGDPGHWISACPQPKQPWQARQPWRQRDDNQTRPPLPTQPTASVVIAQRPEDDGRYGPTAGPSRINCIMTDDGDNRVATTYHEPAMAAVGDARRSGRPNPATGRINKTPSGPRFTQPNDVRQETQQHRPAQTMRQGSTETLRPIIEDVEMGNNDDDGDNPPRRRPAAGPRELVPVRPPKANRPIRAIEGEERFSISEALNQEVSLPMKQLLDISPAVRKQMAFALQLATPRYRR